MNDFSWLHAFPTARHQAKSFTAKPPYVGIYVMRKANIARCQDAQKGTRSVTFGNGKKGADLLQVTEAANTTEVDENASVAVLGLTDERYQRSCNETSEEAGGRRGIRQSRQTTKKKKNTFCRKQTNQQID